MRNYFLKRIGNNGPKTLRLPPDNREVTIGRLESATFTILSAGISRQHATLKKRLDEWYIKDNNSVNGIRVNNTSLTPSTWYHIDVGDIIAFTPPEAQESYAYKVCIDMSSPAREQPETVKHVPEQKELHNKIKEMEKLLQEKDQAQKELEAKLEEMNAKRDAELRAKLEEDRRLLEAKYQSDLESELSKKEEALMEQLQQQTRRIMEEMEDVQGRLKDDYTKQLSERNDELKEKLENEKSKLNSELRQANSKMKLLKEQIKNARSNGERSNETAAIVEREKVVKSFTEVMDMELQCSICSELFIKTVTLNCAHSFCEFCIAAWENTNKICPICRAPITTKSNSIVVDSFIDKICENLSDEMKKKRRALVAERTAQMEAAKKTNKPPRKKQRRSAQTTAANLNVPSTSGTSRNTVRFQDTNTTRSRPPRANRTATTTNVPPVTIPHLTIGPMIRIDHTNAHRNNQSTANVFHNATTFLRQATANLTSSIFPFQTTSSRLGLPDSTSTSTSAAAAPFPAAASPNRPASPVTYISSDSDSDTSPSRPTRTNHRRHNSVIVVSDTEDGV